MTKCHATRNITFLKARFIPQQIYRYSSRTENACKATHEKG